MEGMEKPLPSSREPGDPLWECFYSLHLRKHLTGISNGQRHLAQGYWCLDEGQSRDPGVWSLLSLPLLQGHRPGSGITCTRVQHHLCWGSSITHPISDHS